MEIFKEYYAKHFISLLFSIFGTQILLYSANDRFNIIYCIISTIMIIAYFFIFKNVVNLKKKGIVLYSITNIIVLVIAIFFISFGSTIYDTSYYIWIMGNEAARDPLIIYEIATLIGVPFIFTSFAYYYSVNIFRMFMLLLISFIARTLYIKSAGYGFDAINYIFIFLILLMYIEKNLNNKKTDDIKVSINYKLMSIYGSALVSIIFIFGFIIPKPLMLPKIPILEEMKLGVFGLLNFSGDTSDTIADNSTKNINESMGDFKNKLLFSFTGDNPEYLIEKNYTLYENNKWISEKTPISNVEFNGSSISDVTFTGLMCDQGKETSNVAFEISQKESITKTNSLKLQIEDINTKILPHPPNVSSVSAYDRFMLDGYDRVRLPDNKYLEKDQSFNLEYPSLEPIKGSREDYIMREFNLYSYIKLFEDLGGLVAIDELKKEYRSRRDIYAFEDDVLSDEVKELTNNITKESNTHYDAAKKIEEYLKSNNFTYSLELPKQKGKGDYINYFITEGRTGYCVQFATAMTLMCRSLEIEARYCEGYLITEDNFVDGKYLVTMDDGHAFVEVYLPGYGWKVFDPTPSVVRDREKDFNFNDTEETSNSNTQETSEINYLYISLALIGFILISIIIVVSIKFYNKITERPRFLKRVSKLPLNLAVEELIKNSIELLALCALTPYAGETLQGFAIRVDKSISIGFIKVVEQYYEYKYAENEATKEFYKEALEINEVIYQWAKK